MEDAGGYRVKPVAGPRVRTDIVDVYIFRRRQRNIEFLQMRRSANPLKGTWHPVMGHIEAGETAALCARRELIEEVGLEPGDADLIGMWALEQVHPFFIAAIDQVIMSPRFAVEVRSTWSPRVNEEHTGVRWVKAADVARFFMWPGQLACCAEIVRMARKSSIARAHLEVPLPPGSASAVTPPVPARAKAPDARRKAAPPTARQAARRRA